MLTLRAYTGEWGLSGIRLETMLHSDTARTIFCLCPENISEAELERHGLTCRWEGFPRRGRIQAVSLLRSWTLSTSVVRGQHMGQKGGMRSAVWWETGEFGLSDNVGGRECSWNLAHHREMVLLCIGTLRTVSLTRARPHCLLIMKIRINHFSFKSLLLGILLHQ